MNSKERMLKFLDYKGITQYEFSKKTGLSNGFLKSGSSISSENMELISNTYNDLNVYWLVTGKGDMLNNGIPSELYDNEKEFITEGDSYNFSFDLIKKLIKANDIKHIHDENEDIKSALNLCNALLDNYSLETRDFQVYIDYSNKKVRYDKVLSTFKDSAKIAIELNEMIAPYKKTIEDLYRAIQSFDDSHDRLFRYKEG